MYQLNQKYIVVLWVVEEVMLFLINESVSNVRIIILPFICTTNEYMKAIALHLYHIVGSAYIHTTNEVVRKTPQKYIRSDQESYYW